MYIWNQPLQDITGTGHDESKPQVSGSNGPSSTNNSQPPSRHGGSQSNDLAPKNVAGRSAEAARNNTGEYISLSVLPERVDWEWSHLLEQRFKLSARRDITY